MSATLKSQLTEDMKSAMRAREKHQLGVIRLILAAIKQIEVDKRIELDDAGVLTVLQKMMKQRKESIKQYIAGNRQDLADIEEAECKIIKNYLPESLSNEELDHIIKQAIESTGAQSMADMGKVMGIVKSKSEGRADMGVVSQRVKAALN